MKVRAAFRLGTLRRRLLAVGVAVNLVVASLTPIGAVSAADTGGIATSGYTVQINETVSNGFTHPGIGLTKTVLENMRAEVLAQKEPWYSYYQAMLVSSAASKTVTSSNQSASDPSKPATDAFNSQGVESKFIADGLKAYTQALLYYITGDETYRANALHIIRIWSQMDPAKYAYYTDAHIHAGIPLNRMATAAEIIRYSSYQTPDLAWTDQDTANFTNNLINPVINTLEYDNSWFMNQNNYAIIGAMAGYIFTDNREGYNQRVEWFTVNKTAMDQGFNGSIKQLFRWVDTNDLTGEKITNPHVQHVEMGRDQAHGGGDLTNAVIISRMMLAQGTKVDPVDGTVSTNADAVGPYEFLNDRILAAANYFWQYMLGYDTPWTPVAYSIDADGSVRDTYNRLAGGYRGRFNTANFWDLYSYYTYVKGVNVAEKAPYYYEAFTKKLPSNFYYNGGLAINWDNVDGGGDFWLYIPKEAEADAAKFIPKPQASPYLIDIEDRYTAFDNTTSTMQEGDTSFIRFNAVETGSKIAIMNASTSSKTIGFRIRTNGTAQLVMSPGINDTLTLPDTKGEWRYVTYTMGTFQGLGDLLYMTVKGPSGTTVDIDNLNIAAGTQLTPPVFNAGNSDLNIASYVGAPLSIDLSAADSSVTDVVYYDSSNLPQGSVLTPDTGAFSWQPTQAGTYSFTIQASDGTTVTAKNVRIVVTTDRASAVQEAISPYNPDAIYVAASLANYKAVYDATMSQIETASDEAFIQQLQALRNAAETLQLVTPVLKSDGSMDYANLVTSTFGTGIALLTDNDNDTFTGFKRYPDAYHILDFGPDFKVSATAFGVQSRMNFTDRGAGIIVLGSNDGANWTRLTPDETPFNSGLNVIAVADEYKNMQYRFIKIQMIDPQPDIIARKVQNIMELGEFRIYGQRYETNNKIASVSIGSDQSVSGRIVIGNTVKLTIQAKEAIQNVKVKIQGQDAAVSTTDNINWTAAATLNQGAATGPVTFSIDYQRNDGTSGDTVYTSTDNSKLFLADESDLIGNVTSIANVTDSSGRTADAAVQQANYLFDGSGSTFTDYRLNGSGAGSYVTFDFKEGNEAQLSSVELLARQDGYYTRIAGTVVQGSNDNATWTTLTKGAASTTDWQSLAVSGTASYRYIRIFNGNSWYGNMAEVRFHGVVKHLSKIASAAISSEQSVAGRIVPGNSVKLAFTSTEPLSDVNVTIQGQAAAVSSTDNINWTAVATMNQGAAAGNVNFTIAYNQQDGAVGFPIHTTTDNSALFIVDESDLIRNVTSIANLIDSTSGRTAATTLQIVNSLFDGNASTFSDFRNGSSSGAGSYITFDFKAGNQATLSSVELLARQDQVGRIKGVVAQGSNDNATWTTLTTAAASTANWQSFPVTSKVPYRYIRIYNAGTWYGNMAEVRLHGVVKAADVTPPVTTDDAPQVPVNKDTKVTFTAVDESSGVAATYYTVDGGAQQTGNSVTLTEEGSHTLVYWSTDWAGNAEQPHTVAVNVDKTAPVSSASVSPTVPDGTYGWYASDVTVSLSGNDMLSGVAETVYQVNDGPWMTYTGSIPAFGDGVYTVNYRSTDKAGNVEPTKTVAFKVDKTAPVLNVQVDQSVIWPANHKMGTVNVTLNASDTGSGIESVILTSVTFNQPDTGLGDVDADIGTEDATIGLRAEKDRVYTITYTATDKAGNKTVKSVTVTVPHDLS